MPTLGGLLKKRRTKDSQTLSKELQAGPTTTGHTATSPTAAEESQHNHHNHHSQQHHNFFHRSHHHHSSNHSANSANSISQPAAKHQSNPSSASKHPDGLPGSMHSPAHHQSSGTPAHSNSGQHANAASIQSIINPSQNNTPQVTRTERTTKGKYTLEDFAIQRTLGTGSFGRVHLVQSKHNHRYYAIKVLKKATIVKMKQIEHTNDERRMLNRVRHPFLVTLWGTWQDSRNLYMVMDFVEGGELFSLLRKSQVSVKGCSWTPRQTNKK